MSCQGVEFAALQPLLVQNQTFTRLSLREQESSQQSSGLLWFNVPSSSVRWRRVGPRPDLRVIRRAQGDFFFLRFKSLNQVSPGGGAPLPIGGGAPRPGGYCVGAPEMLAPAAAAATVPLPWGVITWRCAKNNNSHPLNTCTFTRCVFATVTCCEGPPTPLTGPASPAGA